MPYREVYLGYEFVCAVSSHFVRHIFGDPLAFDDLASECFRFGCWSQSLFLRFSCDPLGDLERDLPDDSDAW